MSERYPIKVNPDGSISLAHIPAGSIVREYGIGGIEVEWADGSLHRYVVAMDGSGMMLHDAVEREAVADEIARAMKGDDPAR